MGKARRTVEDKARLVVQVPGLVKLWLRHRALDEGRDMGDIVAEAVEMYRARKERS